MKKAIAKCGHEDAPELNLPPFRSTYRFVNSMLNNANHMENQQYKLIEKMLEFMQGNQYNNYNRPSYNQYSRNDPEMNNLNFMKQMLQKMMNGDMYDSNSPTTYSNNNNNRTSWRCSLKCLEITCITRWITTGATPILACLGSSTCSKGTEFRELPAKMELSVPALILETDWWRS